MYFILRLSRHLLQIRVTRIFLVKNRSTPSPSPSLGPTLRLGPSPKLTLPDELRARISVTRAILNHNECGRKGFSTKPLAPLF
jgi:hypothetical protein